MSNLRRYVGCIQKVRKWNIVGHGVDGQAPMYNHFIGRISQHDNRWFLRGNTGHPDQFTTSSRSAQTWTSLKIRLCPRCFTKQVYITTPVVKVSKWVSFNVFHLILSAGPIFQMMANRSSMKPVTWYRKSEDVEEKSYSTRSKTSDRNVVRWERNIL